MSAPSATPAAFIWPARYIGDDWTFAYTYTNPDGSPLDLTGAQPQAILFGKNLIAPVFTMQGASGVAIVDPPAGSVIFSVARALTATLRADGEAEGYPTRIQVLLLDSQSRLTTFRVDGVPVLDARFAPLTPVIMPTVSVAAPMPPSAPPVAPTP